MCIHMAKQTIRIAGGILFGIAFGWGAHSLYDYSIANRIESNTAIASNADTLKPTVSMPRISPVEVRGVDTLDVKIRKYGLCDIQELDSTILVHLIYSTSDNFTRTNLYGSLSKAYLEPSFAQKVARAQKILKSVHPNYTLLIWDAARPISVQRKMWRTVEGTENEKYVANGDRGGRHNYGVAVDLTIADSIGQPLDMGTPFDYFGEAAHVGNEADLVKTGIITVTALQNRQLLYKLMKEVDLVPYRREWWHYEEPIPMKEVRKKYKLLDL